MCRHNKINRQDRKCNLNDIEDEFHFVLVCPEYINLRNANTCIPKYISNRPKLILCFKVQRASTNP